MTLRDRVCYAVARFRSSSKGSDSFLAGQVPVHILSHPSASQLKAQIGWLFPRKLLVDVR